MAPKKNTEFKVAPKKLQKHLDHLTDKKKAIGEATGDLRAALKRILETEGYHKNAMKMIREIDAMSETAMRDFMRTFKPMFEAMYSEFWEAYLKEDLLAGMDSENVTKLPEAK